MSVLNAAQIWKSYAADPVLNDVSFQLQAGERVALVGPNGAGKTTLLRIVAGLEAADTGTVTVARGTMLGYLPQRVPAGTGGTLEQELRRAFTHLEKMGAQLREIEEKMSCKDMTQDKEQLTALVERYGNLGQAFEEAGGYRAESKLRAVAAGLGFTGVDFPREVNTFSGGEQTRLRLARLLLEEPDLLLLDEPTNHLDIEAVEWLENYLREWRGSILIVSHDRYFLDSVVGRVLALEDHHLRSYPGNYSAYAGQRDMESATQKKAYSRQQQQIAKDLAYIRTAGTGEREKRQVGSRQKRLEKMILVERPAGEKRFALTFSFTGRCGDVVARLDNVSKVYEEKTVFAQASFEVRWGDRVALVGPNGAGKTTLLRLIAGEIAPDTGQVWLGPSVSIVYFDQHLGSLTPEMTPLQEIMNAGNMTLTEARSYLGKFLFSGDEVFKPNNRLSGGERSRLALAKLGLDDGNFLILDEPTNHLDIGATEELEKAVRNFPGTLLVVSHDRYFLTRATDKILEVCDGKVELYKMPYGEYVEERETRRQNQVAPDISPRRARLEQEKLLREQELAARRQRRRLEQDVSEMECAITDTEQKIAVLEKELAEPVVYENFALAREKGEEMYRLKDELEHLITAWGVLVGKLEQGK